MVFFMLEGNSLRLFALLCNIFLRIGVRICFERVLVPFFSIYSWIFSFILVFVIKLFFCIVAYVFLTLFVATVFKVKLVVLFVEFHDLNVLRIVRIVRIVRIILLIVAIVKILFASNIFLWKIVLCIIFVVFMVVIVFFVFYRVFIIFAKGIVTALLVFLLIDVFFILLVFIGYWFIIIFVRFLLHFFLSITVLSVIQVIIVSCIMSVLLCLSSDLLWSVLMLIWWDIIILKIRSIVIFVSYILQSCIVIGIWKLYLLFHSSISNQIFPEKRITDVRGSFRFIVIYVVNPVDIGGSRIRWWGA